MNKLTHILARLAWSGGAALLLLASAAPAAVQVLDESSADTGTDSSLADFGRSSEQPYVSPFENLPGGVSAVPYLIRGSSRQELRSAIMALADDHAGDRADQESTDRFGAVTLSEYSFNLLGDPALEPQDMGDSCRCTAKDTVEVTLVMSVRYPVWVDMAACEDASLVEDWKQYVTSLYRHELGHTYIARAGLGKLRRQLNGVRAYGRGAECAGACSRAAASYHDRVRQAFLKITGEISQDQERYDRETGYGKSQGATF
jgi:hypothetical protein